MQKYYFQKLVYICSLEEHCTIGVFQMDICFHNYPDNLSVLLIAVHYHVLE